MREHATRFLLLQEKKKEEEENSTNLDYIFNDKPAVYSHKHNYTEIEETCMTLQPQNCSKDKIIKIYPSIKRKLK